MSYNRDSGRGVWALLFTGQMTPNPKQQQQEAVGWSSDHVKGPVTHALTDPEGERECR